MTDEGWLSVMSILILFLCTFCAQFLFSCFHYPTVFGDVIKGVSFFHLDFPITPTPWFTLLFVLCTYSRIRCLLRVKSLVIYSYLGWSGSILQIRTDIIKVDSKSWLLTCSSNIIFSLPSYSEIDCLLSILTYTGLKRMFDYHIASLP